MQGRRGVDPKVYIEASIVKGSCWIWQKHIGAAGYGQAWHKGKPLGAHVLSYRTFKGPIGPGQVVRHTCDVRACCNPDHLLLGSYADNMKDCVDRGRIARGEDQGLSKLNWEAVKRIRTLGEPSSFLADLYGVTRVTINRVRRYDTWRDTEGPAMPA